MGRYFELFGNRQTISDAKVITIFYTGKEGGISIKVRAKRFRRKNYANDKGNAGF